MSWLPSLLIVVGTIVGMEVFATVFHRYFMHGPGWGWHGSHHSERHGLFELNDAYAVVFAGASFGFMLLSLWWPPSFYVGLGLIGYGVLYAVVHDGLVHQRWPFRHVPRRGYLKRLYQAHKLHHAVRTRDGGVSFGFLYAPQVEGLRAALARRRQDSSAGRNS